MVEFAHPSNPLKKLKGFSQEGGLGKVHQVFGDKLNKIIEELNGALAA